MLFVVQFEDDPEKSDVRQRLIKDHIAWLDTHKDRVLVGGSLRQVPSDDPVGGLWIVDVKEKSEIEDLLRTDPFWIGGLRKAYRINRWTKAFPDRRVPI